MGGLHRACGCIETGAPGGVVWHNNHSRCRVAGLAARPMRVAVHTIAESCQWRLREKAWRGDIG